jgi:hypothetical protein
MAIVQTIGIDMPSDFPTVPYNAINATIGLYRPKAPSLVLWGEYAAGWNAVASRFKTAADADNAFNASITQSTTPPPPERQMQEEKLFVFFVAGYSVVDSLAYTLYALGAMLHPAEFPMTTPAHFKAIGPALAQKKFAAVFTGTPIDTAFSVLTSHPTYKQWNQIRNILAHRSTPPRNQAITVTATTDGGAGTSTAGPTAWQIVGGLVLDNKMTTEKRAWLAQHLTECVRAIETFVSSNFPGPS